MEHRRQSTTGLNYQGRRTSHTAHHHRDGLAHRPFPAAVQIGAKIPGAAQGYEPDAEEKSRRGHWPTVDGRSVAAPNRPHQGPRTQLGHDRWLSILEVPRKT